MSEISHNSSQPNTPASQPKIPPKITIHEKWCKKCGICIAFCPKKVFDADDFGLPLANRPEQCIRCMLCVIRCPDFAVDVEGTKEDQKKKATQP
jgi:2-oxoglutarate ferredoxin oxidoreductase subunit delta